MFRVSQSKIAGCAEVLQLHLLRSAKTRYLLLAAVIFQMGSEHPCHFFVIFHHPGQKICSPGVLIFLLTNFEAFSQFADDYFVVVHEIGNPSGG
jgi:hypothetical protein